MKYNFSYHLLTFGCQMNKSDSERIKTILGGIDMSETQSESEADVIIMNTCSVRQRAEDRIFGLCTKFDRMNKQDGKKRIIVVTGCMPGRDHDGKLRKKLPMVDLFFDIQRITELPEMLSGINKDINSGNPLDQHYLSIKPKYKNAYSSFIPVQTGCNKFCTYCVVPFSRGQEINRPLKHILEEARTFAANGGKEIILLGQTVNSYQVDDPSFLSPENPYTVGFAQLMWEVDQIDGIERMYFTAPHARDMQDEVIDAMGLESHINYLHLPVQSGSDEVLKRMNRQYTAEMFKELVDKIRYKHPDISLATDIIVGFCGESEEDFQQTIDLYKYCDFDVSFTAQYSQRTGTLAYKGMKDDVSIADKKRRWKELQAVMNDITFEKNKKFQDKTVSVLFDEYDPEKNVALGWSSDMKKVKVKTPVNLTGHIVDVKITNPSTWVMDGEVLEMPNIALEVKPLKKGLPVI